MIKNSAFYITALTLQFFLSSCQLPEQSPLVTKSSQAVSSESMESYSQEQFTTWKQQAISEAEQDFSKGTYILRKSLLVDSSKQWESVYDDLLLQELGIQRMSTPVLPDLPSVEDYQQNVYDTWYSITMTELLQKKYGEDIFSNVRTRAHNKYFSTGLNAEHFVQGKEDATRDVKAGALKIEEPALYLPWYARYKEFMKSNYFVEVVPIGSIDGRGSHVSDSAQAHAHGYNSVSLPVILKKFGENVINEAISTAREE